MCTETFLRLPEEKRNRFLDAAWEEFTRVSFGEVSINKIVRRARISRGSFYQYFSDKGELFFYLLDDVHHRFAVAFNEVLQEEQGDFFDVVLRAYDCFIERCSGETPMMDRCIRLLKINPGINPERIIVGKPREKEMEQVWARLETTDLRQKTPAFAQRVFTMAALRLGVAIGGRRPRPEQTAESRAELVERLEIIKCGSLAKQPV